MGMCEDRVAYTPWRETAHVRGGEEGGRAWARAARFWRGFERWAAANNFSSVLDTLQWGRRPHPNHNAFRLQMAVALVSFIFSRTEGPRISSVGQQTTKLLFICGVF